MIVFHGSFCPGDFFFIVKTLTPFQVPEQGISAVHVLDTLHHASETCPAQFSDSLSSEVPTMAPEQEDGWASNVVCAFFFAGDV